MNEAYQALKQWAEFNKAQSIFPTKSQWGWKGWEGKKSPTRRQGIHLQLKDGVFDPIVIVWGIPTTPKPADILRVAIADEYRHILLGSIAGAMQKYPANNPNDVTLMCELGFGQNMLFASADNSQTYEWQIVPAWESTLNLAGQKLANSLNIRGLGSLEIKGRVGNKLGDLCGHQAGSTDPSWVLEAVVGRPITFDKAVFENTADVFDKLTKSPRVMGYYKGIPEEYLRDRMVNLGESIKPWAEARNELPSFEGMMSEIIEEALLSLVSPVNDQAVETPVSGGRRRQ